VNRAERFAAGRPSDPAAAVVAAMAEAFEQAAAAHPSGTRGEWYRFGGQPLHLRIAGDALHETMAGAFAHLRADSSPGPALTVSLWDGAATGVPCPVRNLSEVFPHTAPFGPSVVASTPDDRVIGYQSHATTTIYDRATRRVIGWVDAADRLSLFERGKPLQSLLFAWQLDEGIAPIHAGLVARGGRGVLFGGVGGSGKTTTALLCLAAGFEYLGDDYAGLPASVGAEPRGFSYYLSSWLEPDHAQRFPWLLQYAQRGTAGEDKLLVPASAIPGARFPESVEIVAIALPRVTGRRETAHRPATMGEAVFRLAPSSILQLPFVRGRLALDRLTELASRVPSYWLELGTDLPEIPRHVGRLLAEAAARSAGDEASARVESREGRR
jgi:hypothetical protein